MATNIRIGFKTYRDLEKMDLGQLTEVRTALFAEVRRIQAMPNTTAKAQLVSAMDRTMQRNNAILDRCAKALINTALPMPMPKEKEDGAEPTGDAAPAEA